MPQEENTLKSIRSEIYITNSLDFRENTPSAFLSEDPP